MNKVWEIFKKMSWTIGLLMYTFILLVLVLVDRGYNIWFYYSLPISNKWIVLTWAVFGFGAYHAAKRKKQKKRIYEVKEFGKLPILILLVIQIFVVYHIFFYVGWDVQYLYEAAHQMLSGGLSDFSQSYFATNPNNVVMLAINIAFQFLGNIIGINGYILMAFVGIILVDLAIYWSCKVVELICGKTIITWCVFGILVILIGLSPWIMVPYSDVYSICLPILSVYLYLLFVEKGTEIGWKEYISVYIPTIIGALLKPTNIIIGIAIGIVHLFRTISQKGQWKKLGRFFVSIMLVAGACMLVRQGIYATLDYEPNEYRAKTVMHYMLIGSNADSGGNYNWEDNDYTDSFPTAKEKNQADWALVKQRYQQMGLRGMIKHFTIKTDYNFNMGILGWGKEPDFINFKLENNTFIAKFLRNLYYPNEKYVNDRSFGEGGKYFYIYAMITQVIWILVLVGCWLSCLWGLLTKLSINNNATIIMLATIGITIFVTIFETNARYLFSYVPTFAVLFAISMKKIYGGEVYGHEKDY